MTEKERSRTKFEARQAAQRATQDGTRTRRQESKHQRQMDKWARWYDGLNGAPEGDNDR